jgi:hypothetical protein
VPAASEESAPAAVALETDGKPAAE